MYILNDILKKAPDNIKQDLNIKTARWIDEVLEIALESSPTPVDDKSLQKNQKEPEAESKDSVRPSTH